MRNFILILMIQGYITSAWGADPLIGTWKLDKNKSNIHSSMATTIPDDLVENYREIDDGLIEYKSEGTQPDGTANTNKYTWPIQGGQVERTPPLTDGLEYVEILVAPGDWYVAVLQNGVQVFLMRKTISTDGKNMYQTRSGINEQGEVVESKLFYIRQ